MHTQDEPTVHVALCSSLNFPGGHSEHPAVWLWPSVELSAAVPAAQGLHDASPAAENRPLPHSEQAEADAGLTEPAWQVPHAEAPDREKRPDEQATHEADWSLAEYEPAEQLAQRTAAGPEKVPFRQATQAVRAASMREPGSQGVHADWPEAAETRPSSHTEHAVLPTLPLLAE
jgi:hypothetical protein